jgi:hypothetical protein
MHHVAHVDYVIAERVRWDGRWLGGRLHKLHFVALRIAHVKPLAAVARLLDVRRHGGAMLSPRYFLNPSALAVLKAT